MRNVLHDLDEFNREQVRRWAKRTAPIDLDSTSEERKQASTPLANLLRGITRETR